MALTAKCNRTKESDVEATESATGERGIVSQPEVAGIVVGLEDVDTREGHAGEDSEWNCEVRLVI